MSGMSGIGVFWAFASFLASIGACVGFYMPYWTSGHMGDGTETPVHFGIFRRCNYPALDDNGQVRMVMECGRYTKFTDIPSISWQIATLAIGVGCGLSLLVSLTAMFGVCVRGVVIPNVARTAGIIQMCSSMLIGTGIGMYPNGWDSPEVRQACGYVSKAYCLGECTLGWCFYLTSVGAGMTLLCAMLSCHAPKRKQITSGYQL